MPFTKQQCGSALVVPLITPPLLAPPCCSPLPADRPAPLITPPSCSLRSAAHCPEGSSTNASDSRSEVRASALAPGCLAAASAERNETRSGVRRAIARSIVARSQINECASLQAVSTSASRASLSMGSHLGSRSLDCHHSVIAFSSSTRPTAVWGTPYAQRCSRTARPVPPHNWASQVSNSIACVRSASRPSGPTPSNGDMTITGTIFGPRRIRQSGSTQPILYSFSAPPSSREVDRRGLSG
ncbi:hypothetical protein T492DRAFT_11602 [Pavlovales sp. CCMP2436]|nr:hypothetical protein T492DRAFT_11602 [Pavlovales sp. CCMP2436]|mmetsp:Transcript_29568/g.69183  ORF Transcript_29568/g.69183 Transcript_29568/m.69183 type:complete len:242 (+) Transcript_29568:162-887(+)